MHVYKKSTKLKYATKTTFELFADLAKINPTKTEADT